MGAVVATDHQASADAGPNEEDGGQRVDQPLRDADLHVLCHVRDDRLSPQGLAIFCSTLRSQGLAPLPSPAVGKRASRRQRRRRWVVIGLCVAVVIVAAGSATVALGGGGKDVSAAPPTTTTSSTTTTTLPPTTTTTLPPIPSSSLTLSHLRTVTGNIAPKSVVASPTAGLVFAQNMMYRHTVTAYDTDGNLRATIPDSFTYPSGTVQGAPVEAAFSPDGSFAYVSNYSMYGPGYTHQGADQCGPNQGIDNSLVYRINTATLAIDSAINVGQVPKYVAVTPDGRYLLVSNWCSFDLSVVDTLTNVEVKRIYLGPTPRGIAVDLTSRFVYVAVMGSSDIAVVDLTTFAVDWIRGVGPAPRHLVRDDSGQFLYATINDSGQVVKIDLTTRTVVGRVSTGSEPRSMDIAPDGESVYVVNYNSNTVSKVRTSDMVVIQTVSTGTHPIGITYEPIAKRVWVACYSGTIMIFNDA
ncbi:MAG: YncE family protein [Actinobacteria bacterium]|nr:YncE family protein [Actinomycetota bacterium]